MVHGTLIPPRYLGLAPSELKVRSYPRHAIATEPPTGFPRPVKQAPRPAHEPLLQTGQARLGALLSLCRGVAREPCAPVGQADWGQAPQPPTGLSRRSSRFPATPPPPTPPQPPTGLPRPVKQPPRPAHEPLLQTGQARLGARASCCREVAANLALQSGKPTGGDHRSPRRACPQCHLLSAPNRSGTARAVR